MTLTKKGQPVEVATGASYVHVSALSPSALSQGPDICKKRDSIPDALGRLEESLAKAHAAIHLLDSRTSGLRTLDPSIDPITQVITPDASDHVLTRVADILASVNFVAARIERIIHEFDI